MVIPSIHYMTTRYVTPVVCETVWKGYLSVVWFSDLTMGCPIHRRQCQHTQDIQ
jgi:hypothetical protein